MKKQQASGLDFQIDKLTNSIENIQSFPTEISLLTGLELKSITRKNDWRFNWSTEYKIPEREVYKLTISNNPNII